MAKISIDGLITKLDKLNDVIKVTCDESGKIIADELAADITERYHSFISSLDKDPQDRSDTTISVQRLTSGFYRVDISGSQVIYDEFGTGLPGKIHPHPEKSQYGLDPYLSGQTIRYDKNGLPYWTFNHKVSYGVPSGQFVYKAYSEWEDTKAKLEVSKELLKNIDKWKGQ